MAMKGAMKWQACNAMQTNVNVAFLSVTSNQCGHLQSSCVSVTMLASMTGVQFPNCDVNVIVVVVYLFCQE